MFSASFFFSSKGAIIYLGKSLRINVVVYPNYSHPSLNNCTLPPQIHGIINSWTSVPLLSFPSCLRGIFDVHIFYFRYIKTG